MGKKVKQPMPMEEKWRAIYKQLDARGKFFVLYDAMCDLWFYDVPILSMDVDIMTAYEQIRPKFEELIAKRKRTSENNKKGGTAAAKKRNGKEDIPYADQMEQYPFIDFWNLYDKHRDEKKCIEIWRHLSDDTKAKIMHHVPLYLKMLDAQRDGRRYQKNPLNYLKCKTWNDEYKEEELTPQNYGNNNRQYNSRELAMQQNDAKCLNIMSEALANIKPYGTADTGPVAIGTDSIL